MAVTLEYGKCAACQENNPKSLQQCRACGAALPWSKSAKKGKPDVGAAPPRMGASDVAWLGIAVMGLGGLMVVAGFLLYVLRFLRIVYIPIPFISWILIAAGGAIWHYGSTIDK